MQEQKTSLGNWGVFLQNTGCAICAFVLLVPMVIFACIILYAVLATWLELFFRQLPR